MDLDSALERLRDLPDSQLVPVARQLDEDAARAIARRDKARQEILDRLAQTGGKVIDGGGELVQVNMERQYEWDAETIRKYAPEHVELVPGEVIPAYYKVKNTTALNNYIANLGKTEKAEALSLARRIKREVPKFKYMIVKGENEE